MRKAKTCILSLLAGVALFGCDPPPTDINCAKRGAIELTSTTKYVKASAGKSIKLQGTARHLGGIAIRTIHVLGLPATNGGFNFDPWTITIPADVLQTLLPASESAVDGGAPDGSAAGAATVLSVDATAEDACGGVAAFTGLATILYSSS